MYKRSIATSFIFKIFKNLTNYQTPLFYFLQWTYMCRALFDTAKTSLYLYTYRICFDVAMRNTLLYWFILKPTHVFSSMTMIQYSFSCKIYIIDKYFKNQTLYGEKSII